MVIHGIINLVLDIYQKKNNENLRENMKILNNLITYDVNFEVIVSSIISHIITYNNKYIFKNN